MVFQDVPRAVPYTVRFPLVTWGAEDWSTSATITSGDCKTFKDGGSILNTVTLPAYEPIGTAWVEIQLSESEMDGEVIAVQLIDQSNPKAFSDTGALIYTSPKPTGKVVSDGSNTTSTFKTNLTQAANFAPRSFLVWLTGDNKDQISKITGFNAGSDFVTTEDAFTSTPADGDYFQIINR